MKTEDTAVEQRASRKRLDRVDAHILGPQELTDYWPAIAQSIAIAQHLDAHDKWITNLHQMALSGVADIWGIFADSGDDKNLFAGTLATDTRIDQYTGNRTMVILSFQSFEVVGTKAWLQAFDILVDYAKENNIHSIAAMTKNPRVVKLMELLDFEIKTVGTKEVTP